MSYDPVQRHRDLESLIVRKRIGGDQRKYYGFRHDSTHGGIITADCAGCALECKFCWTRTGQCADDPEGGEYLGPGEVGDRILALMRTARVNQTRVSGGEPTIGRPHLLGVLNHLRYRRVRFVLETNGILIGHDETYAQDLADFPFLHVRVSLKGCSEEEFGRLTGADPKGFLLQLAALRNLVNAGISAHPAVMSSFSHPAAIDRFYSTIWKIDPRMHSEVEKELVVPYPYPRAYAKPAPLPPDRGRPPVRRLKPEEPRKRFGAPKAHTGKRPPRRGGAREEPRGRRH